MIAGDDIADDLNSALFTGTQLDIAVIDHITPIETTPASPIHVPVRILSPLFAFHHHCGNHAQPTHTSGGPAGAPPPGANPTCVALLAWATMLPKSKTPPATASNSLSASGEVRSLVGLAHDLFNQGMPIASATMPMQRNSTASAMGS